MHPFSIVEFEDGLQLVPRKWVIDDTSWWPSNITSQISLNKLNIGEIHPEDTWDVYAIKKIYVSASKYLEAFHYFIA